MIVLKNVTKTYDGVAVLDHVSLTIEPGEFVCVTGPSGAGKSTLLSLLIGAQDATEGSIEVDGVDLRRVPSGALQMFRRRVGVVFQDYKLLQNRTVEENIAFPLEVCGATDKEIRKRVPELLKGMDLTQRAKALPRELSGGEKARTAIARAIVHKPMILLADEPTGNLDPYQSGIIVSLFQEIQKQGATVILATHDLAMVQGIGARMLRIEHGKIVEDSAGKHGRSARGRLYTAASHQARGMAKEPAVPTKIEATEEQPAATATKPVATPVIEPSDDVLPKKKRRGPPAAHHHHAASTHPHPSSSHVPPEQDDDTGSGGGRKVRITSIHSD